MFKVFVLLVVILKLFKLVHSDSSNITLSFEDMAPLLQTQKSVIDTLTEYLKSEEERLDVIKSYLKKIVTEHEEAQRDKEKYLQHPTNAFILIKRLSIDYNHVKILTFNVTEYKWKRKMLYPKAQDMTTAALNVARLLVIYDLYPMDFADGLVKTRKGSPMTASDCYHLALRLFNSSDYEVAALWFTEALHKTKFQKKTSFNPVSVIDTISYIIRSYHYCGKRKEATFWGQLLKKFSDDFDPITNFYKKGTANEGRMKKLTTEKSKRSGKWQKTVKDWLPLARLCRYEVNISETISSKLFCSYLRRTPYLMLAPIKMEQIYVNPDIFLFHEVLSEFEIKALKKTVKTKNKLERSKVFEYAAAKSIDSVHLIGKSAFIDDEDIRVLQRVQDMTGLNLEFAERFQVGYYGIGGLFNLHHDVVDEEKISARTGNRLATMIFYLSDVEQGGATVFVIPGLTVTPIKGSALYWTNRLSSGKIDKRLIHAGCPVLLGSKWVATKWIHGAGQELIRPCPLVEEKLTKQKTNLDWEVCKNNN